MEDHIRGAESDSGLKLSVQCPGCGGRHRVALTRLDGRFAFSCSGDDMAGRVNPEQWERLKAAGVGGDDDRPEG